MPTVTLKPEKTNLSLGFLQRSVRKWEVNRANRLSRWRHAKKVLPRNHSKRKQAWKAFRDADKMLDKRRAQLKYRQAHHALTSREKTVRYAESFAGKVRENPYGSNRGGIITVWEQRLGPWLVGEAWCGTFAGNMLLHGGVRGVSARLAGVGLIEDDARAGRGPFKAWVHDTARVRPGDLVVLFGRGVHVEIVRFIKNGVVYTVGGNTSAGSGGSQSNGGGVYKRARPLNQVHGFALVNFPS